MSGRLCCCKQQHSKLLAQFVFKVSAHYFNTRTKTRAHCLTAVLITFFPSKKFNNVFIFFRHAEVT